MSIGKQGNTQALNGGDIACLFAVCNGGGSNNHANKSNGSNGGNSQIQSGNNNTRRLLPYPLIEAAANGDITAINKVLKHYEGYIIALSTRPLFDEYGKQHLYVDEEIRRTLETKLILKVLQFNMAA